MGLTKWRFFFWQGWKRSAYVGCKFPVEFLTWENSSQKEVTNVVLTPPWNGGPPGDHTIFTPMCNWLLSKTKFTLRTQQRSALFLDYLTLIRAPLPKLDCKNRRNLVLQEHFLRILLFRLRIFMCLCLWMFMKIWLRIMHSAAHRQKNLVPAVLIKLMALAHHSIITFREKLQNTHV